MKQNSLQQLADFGQSFWMDTISRQMIQDGTLRKMIKQDGLRGVTSNPDIFQKAISGSELYEAQIKKLALAGKDAGSIYEGLAVEDIRKAADVLKPVYEQTNGLDGFISLEVSPYLAFDTAATIEEGHRLWEAVGKENVMIKVPATPDGIPAIEQLISDGINVNVTLIFSREAYRQVMEAYISGLEKRQKAGESIKSIASVASFFISRIDVLVDKLLSSRTNKTAHSLLGQVALASGKMAYQDYKEVFSGKRWDALAKAGAQVQRPLWASTSSKNPLYNSVVYVEPLIGADTVNTMPMNTIDAWREVGQVTEPTVEANLDRERQILEDLKAVGIDLEAATWQLVEEGVSKFNTPFDNLLSSISEKRLKYVGFENTQTESLGKYEKAVKANLDAMSEARFGRRVFYKDPSLFTEDPAKYDEISNRLGWVDVPQKMLADLGEVKAVAEAARRAKIQHVVLLGMGGSSLCPAVCSQIFEPKAGFPELVVLDTTSPDAIVAAQDRLEPAKTWFIVASKSGGTLETMSLYHYFRDQLESAGVEKPGQHFIAITDPDTSLAKLGKKADFRAVFLNPADIGGRYSALSYFGLVPMALMGMDVERLLKRTVAFAADLGTLVLAKADPSVRLGAVLGTLAQEGRNKLTLLASQEFAPLGTWIEQLIAESTGKEGKGILPVSGEKPAKAAKYGNDRLFVAIEGAEGDASIATLADGLEGAGHPVVRLRINDVYDLGAEFYRWEVATAVAGALLKINPFDEPNVSEAKAVTADLLKQIGDNNGEVPLPKQVFGSDEGPAVYLSDAAGKAGAKARTVKDAVAAVAGMAQPGDYIALLAFVAPTDANRKALDRAASALRDKTGCAVTVGIGPRYLHSTGQLHKGGAANGIFVVVVGESRHELEIPGQDYDFNTLIRAQGIGDFETLNKHNRRAVLVDLVDQSLGGGTKGVALV